ncbi:hypothetical protein KP509_37G031100 [Ceratopteris richardii]|uniref:H(+)-transporting two-sector ATPase n=1 Tax=Ceratopteris richardii TaxID=49495 RepID=A0A8T2Q7S7_CERRI|nr:hypothetical protein KP509_37G031100 [Ceratopteris richardii]
MKSPTMMIFYHLSQTEMMPFFVAEVFTGSPGKYVSLTETIKGFQMILSGELDSLPEQAFYDDVDESYTCDLQYADDRDNIN